MATTLKPLIYKICNILTVKYPPGMNPISTNLTKIYQSVLNLLSNASQFTESGKITLEVSRFRRNKEEERGKSE
ncbi:hypothetical protein NDI43_18400 [Microcoleus vaginatus GB2-A3]|uniref:hypothetical protein n=1 Tax=Microcoleus vaginatus TaxID=119532 RepID=UPI0032A94867